MHANNLSLKLNYYHIYISIICMHMHAASYDIDRDRVLLFTLAAAGAQRNMYTKYIICIILEINKFRERARVEENCNVVRFVPFCKDITQDCSYATHLFVIFVVSQIVLHIQMKSRKNEIFRAAEYVATFLNLHRSLSSSHSGTCLPLRYPLEKHNIT